MVKKVELPPEVLAVFREEAREQLESAAADVGRLEAGVSTEAATALVAGLKRRLHNVKGAAHTVGFGAVGEVAHAAEDLVKVHIDDGVIPADDLERLVMALAWLVESLGRPDADAGPILEVLGGKEATRERRSGDAVAARSGKEAWVRVSATALEALLPPMAVLALHQAECRYQVGPLQGLAERAAALSSRLEAGETGAEALHQLREVAAGIAGQARWLEQTTRRTSLAVSEMEDEVRRMRLVPFGSLEGALGLSARDAAARVKKSVDLVVEGGEVGLDRRTLEALRAPLTHLVRNAVDHGIEDAKTRKKAKKPERGRVTVSVRAGGDRILVSIADDGAGIDPERVRERAVAAGLLDAGVAERLGPSEILAVLARPGFSTAEEITDLSGRGVGLDVVKDAVEGLGGAVSLESSPGKGTRFVLALPASLLTRRVLLLRSGDRRFALPLDGVLGAGRVDPEQAYMVDGAPCADLAGAPAILHRLGPESEAVDGPIPAVAVETRRGRAALLVDEILGEDEVVVQPLGAPLRSVPGILGATVIGSGTVVPVLKPAEATEIGDLPIGREARGAIAPERAATVLVVDDSITTRTLERHVLESNGYLVLTASDGEEALRTLRIEPVDLVVSDVEMPGLDGIGLLRAIRADHDLASMPVVLVTSLGSDEERRRGLAAGAAAYIVKSRFDQDTLLTTLASLLSRSGGR